MIKEALKFGWDTTKKNFPFLLGVYAIVAIIYVIPRVSQNPSLLTILLSIVFWAIQLIVSMGVIKIILNLVDGNKNDFNVLLSQYKLFFKYLGASVLYGLIVLGGLILFIVPGIIWAVKFMFYPYFVVEKGDYPVASLKKSSSITNGRKWKLFLFGLAVLGINILGFLALIIGLFVTVPMTKIASAYIYRKLSSIPEITTGDSSVAPSVPNP